MRWKMGQTEQILKKISNHWRKPRKNSIKTLLDTIVGFNDWTGGTKCCFPALLYIQAKKLSLKIFREEFV